MLPLVGCCTAGGRGNGERKAPSPPASSNKKGNGDMWTEPAGWVFVGIVTLGVYLVGKVLHGMWLDLTTGRRWKGPR